MKIFLALLSIAVITSSNIEEETVLQTSSQLGVIWETIKYSPNAEILWLKSKGLYQQFINALDLQNSEKNYIVNLCVAELDDRVICEKIADFFLEYIKPIDEPMNDSMNIILITPLIDQQEKVKYSDMLKFDIEFYDDIDQAIGSIKQLQIFTETYIIIDGVLYVDFILLFIKNFKDIAIIPKLILFTKNKEQFLKDNQKDAYLINHPFYNYDGKNGIKTDIYEIKQLIANTKRNVKINYNEVYKDSNNDNPRFNFEYIDSSNKLDLPMQYPSLKRKPQQFEIEKFNNYLLENYTTRKVGLNLFTTDILIELLAKYYIYLYTDLISTQI